MKEIQVVMFCSEGNSDKEYRCQLELLGNLFVVNFQFGRRGQALKSGTKTGSPVLHKQAKKIFDDLIKEKIGKGYVIDQQDQNDANLFVKTSVDRAVGGFLPQLCNAIEKSEVERLMADGQWGFQEKMDGERRSVQISLEGDIVGLNRRGLVVDLPKGIVDELVGLYDAQAPCIVDGEIIGNVFYAFDVILFESNDFAVPTKLPYGHRYTRLSNVGNTGQYVKYVPMASTSEAKLALFNNVVNKNGEGVVLKKLDGYYRHGRPSSGGDWLKFKFTESASCIVLGINQQRSVALSLWDDGKITNVGNVTIPQNHEIPEVGDVVEVRYLYAYKEGCLFQPVYLGKRNDINGLDCTTDQLKYKK